MPEPFELKDAAIYAEDEWPCTSCGEPTNRVDLAFECRLDYECFKVWERDDFERELRGDE